MHEYIKGLMVFSNYYKHSSWPAQYDERWAT